MSGLLTKEFMYVTKQKRLFLIIVVMYAVFFTTMTAKNHAPSEWATLIAFVSVIMTVMLTINTFAYDEAAKWDGFVKSMPVSIGQIVGAKYIFTLFFALVGGLLAEAVDLILSRGHESPETLAFLFAGAVGIPLFLSSVLVSLFYKFGLQKARLAAVAVFLLPTIVSNLLDKVGFKVDMTQMMLLLKLSPVILLVIVGASYLISCGIYGRREV
ncbi:MAG TPA: ABC-2 transporter permease [Caproicibacter sp.]|nr:ABC-2 transporter permease [Caproicibacter sp.]